MNNNIKKKGFTLTELIVVIAIIGILAAVLIPSVVVYIKKARISNDTSDVKNMNTLLNAYVAENDVDLSKLEASDVYAIVNSSDSNFSMIALAKTLSPLNDDSTNFLSEGILLKYTSGIVFKVGSFHTREGITKGFIKL